MSLSDFSVGFKVHLPIWILSLVTLAVGGFGLYALNSNLEQGHIKKVQALVESAIAIAEDNYTLAEAGVLTEVDAQNRARDAIRAMVFDGGSRVFVFDENGIRVVSNSLFKEGGSAWKSPQTKSMIYQALEGGGTTYYRGARQLNGVKTHSVPKVAWSQHFAPWGWVVASAVYLDDVRHEFWRHLAESLIVLSIAAFLITVLANAIIQDLVRPLTALTGNMRELAKGNTDITISGTSRGDEVGEMATAMKTFLRHETHRHSLQMQLKDLAYKDSLTGLSNRLSFYEKLDAEIEASTTSGRMCALMLFDLDRFKSVNDNLGHMAGDTLLVEFARRLERAVGDLGEIGRLSGDEFFVILRSIASRRDAVKVAQRVLEEAEKPIQLDDRLIYVKSSIGIAFGPADTTSASKLYRFADMALYDAKVLGGGCYRCYSPQMGSRADQRFEMETMIKEGLLNGQFAAHYQGKVDLHEGRVCGAEALCRWSHPVKGHISPADFIPIAEETGQIIELGRFMMLEACKFARQCNDRSDEPFVVAVNVSPKQLLYGDFLDVLDECLAETGCEASWLELEITENLLLEDHEDTLHLLDTIADRGITITIDDFGTGYSAMRYLSRFPISCLKIDQSFVREMRTDRQKQILVSAILAMAQGLGLKTVAEGVETEDVAQHLQLLRCDYGQGFLWHQPVVAETFLKKMKAVHAA